MSFVHLHTRSHWSPLGVCPPALLARRAREVGQTALALTDLATVTGLLEFTQACDLEGIRPILGAEIPHQPHFPTLLPEEAPIPVLPALVAQESGWNGLVSLLNRAWFDYRRAEPALRFNNLEGQGTGLFVLTGMQGTELHSLLSLGYLDEAELHLRWLQNALGTDHLLVALEDHGQPRQQPVWRKLHSLAREYGITAVATYGVTHAYPEEAPAAHFLAQSHPGDTFDLRELRSTTTPCLAPASEVHARFANRMPVIDATLAIAEACDWRPAAKNRIPCPPLPRGLDPLSTLVEKAFEGLHQRYQETGIPEEARSRLQSEIEDTRQASMVEPILLLADLMKFCQNHAIPTGLGNGRLLSSVLAWSLGITRINPIYHSLVYVPWPEGSSHGPVLPLEIPWRHASRVAAHLQSCYGEDYHAFVGQWDALPEAEIARQIRHWLGSDPEESARDLLYFQHYHTAEGTAAEEFLGESPSVPMTSPEACAYLIDRLHPRPGTMNVAPGLLALTSESFQQICPTIPTRRGRVTQYTASTLTTMGIPLLHIVPSPALDIVDEVTRWVRENGHPDFSLDSIPLDDRETFESLSAARTAANPPFASTTARMLLIRQQPTSVAELRRLLIELHNGEDYPVHQSVADTMTAYRLAFMAAHFPAPFYAAALTAACGHSHRFHAIAAEARAIGLPLIAPDITTSLYAFSPTRSGILSGLVAVRGMTRDAWQEISRLRDGGPIAGLREFSNRVGDAVTPQLIRNLVHAGCFDAFAASRLHLCIEVENIFRELHEAITPSPDRITQMSHHDLLMRELEASDHLLATDLAPIHEEVWKACRALKPEAVGRRHLGKRITVTGRVTGLEEAPPFLSDPDLVVADVEGLLVILHRDEVPRFEHALYSELPVLIQGLVERTPFGLILTDPTFHHVHELRWAESVIDAIIIEFPSTPTLASASRLLRLTRKYGGGRTWLGIPTTQAPATVSALLSLATRSPVHPVPPLIEALRDLVPDSAIRIECNAGVDPKEAWRYVAMRKRLAPESDTKPRPTPDNSGNDSDDSADGDMNFGDQ